MNQPASLSICITVAEVDPCDGVSCGHGTCHPSDDNSNGYKCVCSSGWTGDKCDEGMLVILQETSSFGNVLNTIVGCVLMK